MKLKIFLPIFFIFFISIILVGCSAESEKYNSFAQCLTEKGIKMYGTEWCPHCKDQKKLFGGSFEYVDYIDCDKNKNECIGAGVKGYPTWIIDEEKYPGAQSLERLAYLSECELVEDI